MVIIFDDYKLSKGLVTSAYVNGVGQVRVVNNPTSSEANAKAFITQLRTDFLNMGLPSINYNAYTKVTDGDFVQTWTRPEDIVLLVRNDILAYNSVSVLAVAFNMSETEFLGRVIPVDTFGNDKVFAFMGDRRWFRIHTQEMYLDEFYNANNRVWNYYLNKVGMFNYSLFANGVILATSAPTSKTTSLKFKETSAEVTTGGEAITLHVDATPFYSNSTVTFTSSSAKATVTKVDDRTVTVTPQASGTAGSATITASAESGAVTATISVTVNAAAGA